MTDNPFSRLATFIQEYVYRAGWTELRGIQIQASSAIFDTPGHVLITSGTASGKTEAAFLPILTELQNHPSATIGVIYIGPLKALLNDQFSRLSDLLAETEIPVQSWHGDIDSSKKQGFLTKAQGILQITPEAMEAMLIGRHHDLPRLFGDVRFVVIDEVHALIASDRGRQVICQLQRLARVSGANRTPRRIGLSATIGDPDGAMLWLAGGTDLPVTLVSDTGNRREIMLGLEHFPMLPRNFDDLVRRARVAAAKVTLPSEAPPPQKVNNETEMELDEAASAESPSLQSGKGDSGGEVPPEEEILSQVSKFTDRLAMLQQLERDSQALYVSLYEMTQRETKTLIFANSRGEAEKITTSLRTLAEQDRQPDIYYIHHGSISAELREAAERAMQEPDHPACVAATITLELGIDLGQLDQVLQMSATPSVASFLQRLGRSGRRGNPARMFFYSREIPAELAEFPPIGKRIPWDLLQSIAIIQLYLEEKWIEPPETPRLPFSLLYHQTMSVLAAHTELQPPELAERVLTLAPFADVTQDQYRTLLHHLLSIEHLARAENGALIVGLAGEKVVHDFHFYATFRDETAYMVRDNSGEIGTVQAIPAPGDRFALAGRTWKVVSVNRRDNVIFAEQVSGKATVLWLGGGSTLHGRILQRIREVLREDTMYPFLRERAQVRLREARYLARLKGLTEAPIVPMDVDRFMVLPWAGTRTMQTLIALLDTQIDQGIDADDVGLPFYFELKMPDIGIEGVQRELARIAANLPTSDVLVARQPRKALEREKYDEFVPESLLRQAYVADYLDMAGAAAVMESLGDTNKTGQPPQLGVAGPDE
jgi:ATP-dependent helicase Lhr and Lhr-like helicase